jgi:hypothetical protein
MKKYIYLISLFISINIFSQDSLHIYKDTAIVVDDNYTDWENIQPVFYINVSDLKDNIPSSSSDFSGIVKISWDEHYLYTYLNITDDIIYTEENIVDQLMVDGFAIGIDGDTEGEINFFWEPFLDSTYVKLYMPFGRTPEEVLQNNWGLNLSMHCMGEKGVDDLYYDYFTKTTDSGYVAEVQFPWSGVWAEKARTSGYNANDMIRMAYQIDELDAKDSRCVLLGNWHIITLHGQMPVDPTSIEHTSIKRWIRLYPNPATDFVHISSMNPLNEIRIYNSVGKQFQIIRLHSRNDYTLNLSDYSGGIYFLKTGQEHHKLLIIK